MQFSAFLTAAVWTMLAIPDPGMVAKRHARRWHHLWAAAPGSMAQAPTGPRTGNGQQRNPTGTWQSAWDWWNNRALLYETYQGGLLWRAGLPGFAKLVEGTWQMPWILHQRMGDYRVAYVYRNRAKIALPPGPELAPPGTALDLVLRLGSLSRRRQTLSVRLGRRLLARKTLGNQGFETLRIPLPEHLSDSGKIQDLSLRFRAIAPVRAPVPDWRSVGIYGLKYQKRVTSAAVLASLAVLPRSVRLPETILENSPFRQDPGTRASGHFALPSGGGLRAYLVLPKTARLRLGQHAGGPIEMRIRTDGSSWRRVLAQTRSRGKQMLWDLTPWAGRAVALEVQCKGPATCELSHLALESKIVPQRPLRRTKIKYVFLWVVDTLRRDSLGVYGSKIVKTPNFDALARHGALFERSIIQGNHSLPSHASILTGRYPPVHTLEHPKARVRGTLLFESYHRAGWHTALFSANGYVSRKWGYRRGIDEYVNFIRQGLASDARHVWRRTLRTIERQMTRRPDQPLFFYILTIDPHVTYAPPRKYRKMYYPGRYRGKLPRRITGFDLNKLISGVLKVRTKDDMDYLTALYRGEITYNDHWFGVMMAELKRLGILDESLIVVTSDHGDEFHEHGSFGHAKSLYQENIAVPLILWWKGIEAAAPIRIPYNVEVQDIFSTVLDLVGLPQPPSAQSASLLPLLQGGRAEPAHAAFAYQAGTRRSVTVGHFKYIVDRHLRRQFFDLTHDPGEHKNLVESRTVAVMAARSLLAIKNASVGHWHKTRWGDAFRLTPAFYHDLMP